MLTCYRSCLKSFRFETVPTAELYYSCTGRISKISSRLQPSAAQEQVRVACAHGTLGGVLISNARGITTHHRAPQLQSTHHGHSQQASRPAGQRANPAILQRSHRGQQDQQRSTELRGHAEPRRVPIVGDGCARSHSRVPRLPAAPARNEARDGVAPACAAGWWR